MLVICCGMYRSGSTLQYQIVSELIEKFDLGERLSWKKDIDFKNIGQSLKKDKYSVLKTHVYNDDILSVMDEIPVKFIYSYRDIRDVVLSLGKKNGKTVDKVLENNVLSEILENDIGWRSVEPIYISRYDDLVNDLKSEIKLIADFLSIKLSDNEAEEMANIFNIQSQKEKIKKFEKSSLTDLGDHRKFDPKSLLHNNHISSGKVSGWIDELTFKQIAQIESKTGLWLKKYGYPLFKEMGNFRFYRKKMGL